GEKFPDAGFDRLKILPALSLERELSVGSNRKQRQRSRASVFPLESEDTHPCFQFLWRSWGRSFPHRRETAKGQSAAARSATRMDGSIATMTSEIILITGGARSGKSRYAEQRVREIGGRSVYVATAEANDEEMAQRIAEHRKRRANQWRTIEEPLELTQALLAERNKTDCALVDCLTLWI